MVIAALAVSALIHLLPLSGVLGADRLEKLYGSRIDDPGTLLAMRHRAVMFGALGAWLLVSIVLPEHRPGAIGVTLASDIAFLALYLRGPALPAWRKVFVADVVSIAALLVAASATLTGVS